MWKCLTLWCMKGWLFKIHAFHDYDSGFAVFFNSFLFLLTIQFKGKKVQSYISWNCLITVVLLLDFLPLSHFEKLSSHLQNLHILAHSRSFMICFQEAVLFFSYENDIPPECLSIGQHFLNIYFFYMQYFQWKGCRNCFWARK